MEFAILGPCEVRDPAGRPLPIRRRKVRALLAVLLYGRNQTVPTETLIARLWAGKPPASAVANLQTYVSELRRVLAGAGLAGCLHTTGAGYLLQVRPGQVDADVFDDLVALGRQALRDGSAVLAAGRLGRALGLWRGEPGAGLGLAGPDHPEPARLAARRLAALTDWVDARLRLGQHQELSGELPALIHRYPGHEPLWCQLMLAHYRCGQPGAATRTYHELRARLAQPASPTVPGTPAAPNTQTAQNTPTARNTPTAQNQRAPTAAAATLLYRRILRNDPALAATATDDDSRRTPRQLPAPPGRFVGRDPELARLDRLLAGPDRGPTLIVGGPGVGKSALALHWAHRAAGRFPDGQLYADLHGHAPHPPAEPLDILRRFLADLGAGGRVPDTVEEAAGRFRTALAGRRMLVLLDDASSAAQVRALLPGSASCLAIVTSRDRLDGLVTREGARRVRLGLLPPAEAAALLHEMRDSPYLADSRSVDSRLAERCGYLPLALRIVGTAGGRADPLSSSDGERSVRAAFDLSYRRLAEPEQRVFRLLGQLADREIAPAELAAAARTTEPEAAELLDRLARVSLIDQVGDGYRLAGLLRAYAQQLAWTGAPVRELAGAPGAGVAAGGGRRSRLGWRDAGPGAADRTRPRAV